MLRKNQFIDVSGTPLTPSFNGKRCLGNGEHKEYECCCDECGYFLKCYPKWYWDVKMSSFKRKWKRFIYKIKNWGFYQN